MSADDDAMSDFDRAAKALRHFFSKYFDGDLRSAYRPMRRFLLLMVRARCTPGDFELSREEIVDYCNDVGIDFTDRFERLREIVERFNIPPRRSA